MIRTLGKTADRLVGDCILQDDMEEGDERVSEHDREGNPYYPPPASSFPVADVAGRPGVVFCERGEDGPAENRTEEHVPGGFGAHDDALPDIRGAGVEGPEPGACGGGSEDGEVAEEGEEERYEGLVRGLGFSGRGTGGGGAHKPR